MLIHYREPSQGDLWLGRCYQRRHCLYGRNPGVPKAITGAVVVVVDESWLACDLTKSSREAPRCGSDRNKELTRGGD